VRFFYVKRDNIISNFLEKRIFGRISIYMSRTYNVNVPVTAYSQVYTIATAPRSVTVTYTLSAETILATPPLSGNDSVLPVQVIS